MMMDNTLRELRALRQIYYDRIGERIPFDLSYNKNEIKLYREFVDKLSIIIKHTEKPTEIWCGLGDK
jgi:hypothetical protein